MDSTAPILLCLIFFVFISMDHLSVMRKSMRNHSQVNRLNMHSRYKDQTKSCLCVRISFEAYITYIGPPFRHLAAK